MTGLIFATSIPEIVVVVFLIPRLWMRCNAFILSGILAVADCMSVAQGGEY